MAAVGAAAVGLVAVGLAVVGSAVVVDHHTPAYCSLRNFHMLVAFHYESTVIGPQQFPRPVDTYTPLPPAAYLKRGDLVLKCN